LELLVMDVELCWTEVRIGILNGTDRRCRSLFRDRQPRYGAAGNWDDDIVGALAELVVAKALNLYPSFGPDPDTSDVGKYHVRATELDHGSLILHRDDPDDGAFLLVVGRPPRFRIVGWCYGHEGKIDAYWSDPTGKNRWAYFIPQGALRPGPFEDELP
jgi:hypothetical protein